MVARLYPQEFFFFKSWPSTTRSATVEVFDPASTRNLNSVTNELQLKLPGGPNMANRLKWFRCYSVLSIAADTNEPLPSKWTSLLLLFRLSGDVIEPLPSKLLYSITI
jgi:hypothetical protein